MSTIFNFTSTGPIPVPVAVPFDPSSWLAGCFARLVESIDQHATRQREAYLSDATDIYDLEDRMRESDRDVNRYFH